MANPDDNSTSNTTPDNKQQTTTATNGTSATSSNWVASKPDGIIIEGADLSNIEKRNK